MRRAALVFAALAATAAPGPATADIRLDGFQHIGTEQSAIFTPTDPVHRAQMQAFPSRFALSQISTITAVRFETPVNFDGNLDSVIVDNQPRAGVLSGATFTLGTSLTLSAGLHTIAPDPGCRLDSAPVDCPAGLEHDIGFSAMVLVSPQDTSARMSSQRHHIGDDNDADDDYGGRFYPDAVEGSGASFLFDLDRNRTLGAVQVYRLRDVEPFANLQATARVLLDGVEIGNLTANGDPFLFEPNRFVTAGTHALRVESGTIAPGNLDSVSFDDILLFFGDAPGGSPGSFNAVDPGQDPLAGPIRTKVAGVSFPLSLYAVDLSLAGPLGTYGGTVRVELLDARDESGPFDGYGCRSSWVLAADLGAIAFDPAAGGVATINVLYDGALRDARVRVTDVDLGVYGCSSDAFAIRPAGFNVIVSHDDEVSAGNNYLLNATTVVDPIPGSPPTHRAGRPFSIRVGAVDPANQNIRGYDGTPETAVTIQILGGAHADVVPGIWKTGGSGVLRTDTALYSEAGAFRLEVGDTSFANIDIPDGSPASLRIVPVTGINVGRFTPDHFVIDAATAPVIAALAPGCGSFTYIGQPLVYATPPAVTLLAVDAAGNTTANYEGNLARFPASRDLAAIYTATDDGTPTAPVVLTNQRPLADAFVTPTFTALGGGRVVLTVPAGLQRQLLRAAAVVPFHLQLKLELAMSSLSDRDGVPYDDPSNATVAFPTAPGTAMAFSGGASQQRFGRLAARNAYGPETSPLAVVFGTEFFAPGGGFSPSTDDTCTLAPAVGVDPLKPLPVSSVPGLATTVVRGFGSVMLTAPGVNSTGSGRLLFQPVESWLLADTNGDGTYDEAADATATFGVFDAGEGRIDLREIFR